MSLPTKDQIREFAEPLIAQGMTSRDLRIAIYQEFGIGIGGGGGGSVFGGEGVPGERCPYCDASGGGGHGGFCPNGSP